LLERAFHVIRNSGGTVVLSSKSFDCPSVILLFFPSHLWRARLPQTPCTKVTRYLGMHSHDVPPGSVDLGDRHPQILDPGNKSYCLPTQKTPGPSQFPQVCRAARAVPVLLMLFKRSCQLRAAKKFRAVLPYQLAPADRIHSDVARLEVRGPRSRERANGRLRGGINAVRRQTFAPARFSSDLSSSGKSGKLHGRKAASSRNLQACVVRSAARRAMRVVCSRQLWNLW